MTILPREMGGPCRGSKLRWIVVETAIVLAADRNCANSSSKPHLSSPPIEIAPIVVETTLVLAADRNCAKSSSKPPLSSPPIEIALNRRRNRNGPRRQSKLRWIVVETTIVLATDRNGDESSSKPQLSSPPIEIAMNLAMTSIGVLVAVNERPVVSKKHFVRFAEYWIWGHVLG